MDIPYSAMYISKKNIEGCNIPDVTISFYAKK